MSQSFYEAAKILGLSGSFGHEALERAFHLKLSEIADRYKLTGAQGHHLDPQVDTDGGSTAVGGQLFPHELEEVKNAYALLFKELTRGARQGVRRDNVVSAELFPGLSVELSESDDPASLENVIDFRKRIGAFGVDSEVEWTPPVLATQGRPQEIEALIGMSELREGSEVSFGAGLDEDEEALDHRSFGGFFEETFEPRKIKSIIGEGQKDVVNIKTANSRLRPNREAVSAMLAEYGQADGRLLIRVREQLGVTQEEVSIRTKVHVRHIDGLERDDYSLMPALVYFKGYISSYLRYLGIDSPQLVQAFANRYQEVRAARARS